MIAGNCLQRLQVNALVADGMLQQYRENPHAECAGALFAKCGTSVLSSYVIFHNSSVSGKSSFYVSVSEYALKVGPMLEKGFQVKAFFHSHLSGTPEPSRLDLVQMKESHLPWLIICQKKRKILFRMYRLRSNKLITEHVNII
jgi:proteasome lid subunit RPN8/RPN11